MKLPRTSDWQGQNGFIGFEDGPVEVIAASAIEDWDGKGNAAAVGDLLGQINSRVDNSTTAIDASDDMVFTGCKSGAFLWSKRHTMEPTSLSCKDRLQKIHHSMFYVFTVDKSNSFTIWSRQFAKPIFHFTSRQQRVAK